MARTDPVNRLATNSLLWSIGVGRPIEDPPRADLEAGFGADFRGVRVHTDESSTAAATAIDAHAFALGQEIAFANGCYRPDTPEGYQLLAHELSHVVEQSCENRVALQRDTDEPVTVAQAPAPQISTDMDKFNEFQEFIRERMRRIGEMNETEARVQEKILRRFVDWTIAHQGRPEFRRASPRDVYERLGRAVVTPEVEAARMRAERAPQADEARQAKLDEFERLARRLRSYRRRFPYLIPVPNEGRDILVEGDPAQQAVFDSMAAELGAWALRHYHDGDFTIQSPAVVLATVARAHQPELRAAQLEPLVFESIARTDIDPATVVTSFATTLGKVLLAAAIVGVVIGAEILTAGQVTWILVGLAGLMGAQAYRARRQEIEATGVDVPRAETVVHAAGDVFGLSEVIEGATGLRLGTERRLSSIERSQELGEGSAQIAGVFVGSRAFRMGSRVGAAWRATAPVVAGRIAPRVFLAGPPEEFPFSSGSNMPAPEFPNRVYRIMSNEEAAAALRTGRIPPGAGSGQMPHKYFSLDSRYAALFRQRALAEAEALARQGKAAEAQALIESWHAAPGQTVVVEIELAPGALEHILRRAVTENLVNRYRGENVFIYKFERGSHNIAVPEWQLERFNALIDHVRLHAWRAPFGPGQIPQGTQ